MRITSMIREMNYAAERAIELKMVHDAGLGDRVPDTFEEFLLVTSGTIRHEPPVRRRGILASALRRSS
jgi:hypothetical protein